MSASPCLVALMGRWPIQGQVKSRLARDVGEAAACEFYRACLMEAVERVRSVREPIHPVLAIADPVLPADAVAWARGRIDLWRQVGDGLSERLAHVFDEGARRGHRKTIVCATDVPDLSTEGIERAVQAVSTGHAVVGPSPDGGFYLLGLPEPINDLFEDVPWSTSSTRAALLQRLAYHHPSPVILQPLVDIDHGADLWRWARSSPHGSKDLQEWVQTLSLTKS